MARNSNNDKSSSSASKLTLRRLTGEKVPDTITPIRFYKKEAKKARQEKEEGEMYDEVDIPVKIDPSGTNDRSNTTKVTFVKLDSFADAGEAVIELRRELNVKIYKPMGLIGPAKMVSRMRYLTMTLGTTAVQQMSKAVSEAFKNVSKKVDVTMEQKDRERMSRNEKDICDWLAKPRLNPDAWDLLSSELQVEEVKKVNEAVENQLWFLLYCLSYPETHAEALGHFDRYVKTQIIKPFGWTITRTLERFDELMDLRQYIPPPGDDVKTALYEEPKTPFTASERRRAEFDLLPLEWQTRMKGKMINWLNKPDLTWTRTLRQVEKEVQLHEKQQEQLKKSTKSKAKEDSDSSDSERVTRAKKKSKSLAHKKSKKTKITSQGKAKFCAYCKSMDRSPEAYTSHNESECFLKNKHLARGFSGDQRQKAAAMHQHEKQMKKQSKQLKEMRKMIKMMARHSGKREARAATAKADQDAISNFMNESETDESMDSDSE